MSREVLGGKRKGFKILDNADGDFLEAGFVVLDSKGEQGGRPHYREGLLKNNARGGLVTPADPGYQHQVEGNDANPKQNQ